MFFRFFALARFGEFLESEFWEIYLRRPRTEVPLTSTGQAMGYYLSPLLGLVVFPFRVPRLAPWAAFLRRFAASVTASFPTRTVTRATVRTKGRDPSTAVGLCAWAQKTNPRSG